MIIAKFPFSSGLPGDKSLLIFAYEGNGLYPAPYSVLLTLDSGKCYLNFILSTADKQSNSLQTSSPLTLQKVMCFLHHTSQKYTGTSLFYGLIQVRQGLLFPQDGTDHVITAPLC